MTNDGGSSPEHKGPGLMKKMKDMTLASFRRTKNRPHSDEDVLSQVRDLVGASEDDDLEYVMAKLVEKIHDEEKRRKGIVKKFRERVSKKSNDTLPKLRALVHAGEHASEEEVLAKLRQELDVALQPEDEETFMNRLKVMVMHDDDTITKLKSMAGNSKMTDEDLPRELRDLLGVNTDEMLMIKLKIMLYEARRSLPDFLNNVQQGIDNKRKEDTLAELRHIMADDHEENSSEGDEDEDEDSVLTQLKEYLEAKDDDALIQKLKEILHAKDEKDMIAKLKKKVNTDDSEEALNKVKQIADHEKKQQKISNKFKRLIS